MLAPWTQPQSELLDDFFAGERPRWLLWMDGMRVDVFDDLCAEYVDGELTAANNGDLGYTGDWADEHLRRDLAPRMGFFSPVPLWGHEHADYDERNHFDVVPAPDAYDSSAVADRLDALGYTTNDVHREGTGWRRRPLRTNAVVMNYLGDIDSGIIRYVAPHPPLVGLEKLTSGRGHSEPSYDTHLGGPRW